MAMSKRLVDNHQKYHAEGDDRQKQQPLSMKKIKYTVYRKNSLTNLPDTEVSSTFAPGEEGSCNVLLLTVFLTSWSKNLSL